MWLARCGWHGFSWSGNCRHAGPIAVPISEQRLAAGGGNARAPAGPPGGRGGLERGLDGGGDELRGLRVDGDVPAQGGLLLSQVRRNPGQLRVALDAALAYLHQHSPQ